MLENAIRNFFVLTTAIYTFYKLLNKIPKNVLIIFKLLTSSIIISLITSLLFNDVQALNWITLFILFFVTIKYIEKQNFIPIYITVLFSFAFSFIVFSLSIIFVSLLFSAFYYNNYNIPWIFVRISIGILQFLLTCACFHIPRLKKGMSFLYHIPSNNIGSTLCIVLFMLIIMFCQIKTITDFFMTGVFSIILILGFLLFSWWNYHLTQMYKKFLRKNELDSLALLLEERNQEILYLKSENEKLASIIHKDNKIIPALSMAVISSTENNLTSPLQELETDSTLLAKLKLLYEERENTLADYQQELMHLPQTAFDSINAILSFMQSEALKNNIPYEVVLFDNLISTIPKEIAEDDFTHLISDLLTNAIHACKNLTSASIQVYLGKMDGISTIRIYNNGNIFDINVLKNLGLARYTTHADTGGSGIGLIDIWKIKERYSATLLIDEIASVSSTYTCINILFNHKNHYIIQSNRHKELSEYINRPDIMIISKD